MEARIKLATTVNSKEAQEIDRYCKKHKVTRYTLLKVALFEKIRGRAKIQRPLTEFREA